MSILKSYIEIEGVEFPATFYFYCDRDGNVEKVYDVVIEGKQCCNIHLLLDSSKELHKKLVSIVQADIDSGEYQKQLKKDQEEWDIDKHAWG